MIDQSNESTPVRLPAGAATAGHSRRSGRTTRRQAMHSAVGVGALALIASGAVGTVAVAQDASPVPIAIREGLHVVVRTRVVKAGMSIDDLNAAIRDGLVPLIAAIPGYVDYYVVQNADTRERTSVSVFTDKKGADTSTTVASDFISGAGGLAGYYEDADPVVLEGDIVVAG